MWSDWYKKEMGKKLKIIIYDTLTSLHTGLWNDKNSVEQAVTQDGKQKNNNVEQAVT